MLIISCSNELVCQFIPCCLYTLLHTTISEKCSGIKSCGKYYPGVWWEEELQQDLGHKPGTESEKKRVEVEGGREQ